MKEHGAPLRTGNENLGFFTISLIPPDREYNFYKY